MNIPDPPKMGEDATRADQSSSTLPAPAVSDSPTAPVVDAQDLFVPSSVPTSPTQTLTRAGSKTPSSPTGAGNQVSAITVVALLDQLVVMIEAVQENQRRMEKRQADLEGTVRSVQADLTRLSKSHTVTSGGVNKLLERSRKTGIYVKEVRERLDRQSGQVKRLEANHSHLLKRNHFKVLIFQVGSGFYSWIDDLSEIIYDICLYLQRFSKLIDNNYGERSSHAWRCSSW